MLVVKFRSVKICCSCERVNRGDKLVALNAGSVICCGPYIIAGKSLPLVPVVADVKVSGIRFFVALSVLL